MIVHTFEVVEAGPKGLIGLLEPHEFGRSIDVEGRHDERAEVTCQVEGCEGFVSYEVTLHRRHSRRQTEPLYLCADDFHRHRGTDKPLRIVVESNR